ncbi:MAG TPA: peptidoglycan editing factor PgeF [Vicinamibacteria bacterium]|nr:peptidoglycan editing factor PgeF [Vicinamibacteria bacterium]
MTSVRAATLPELSAIPRLVHGFEQRLPDAGPEGREAGRARLAEALAPRGRLLLLEQVHGCAVRRAPWEGRPEADAAVAEHAGDILGIETADCLPVLVVDPRRQAVAAAHAGWRGTAAGVARAAVEALLRGGSAPGDLLAALGPGIGPCCYEVGDELRAAFAPAFLRDGPRGRAHLDVRAANRAQLERSGLRPDRIHSLDHCTRCRGDLYHSYRRDGKAAGRMINFVGFSAGFS